MPDSKTQIAREFRLAAYSSPRKKPSVWLTSSSTLSTEDLHCFSADVRRISSKTAGALQS